MQFELSMGKRSMTEISANAIAVGIDLGTTYSAVGQVDEFGQPQIIPNSENQRTTPSVVYIEGDSALVGTIAKDQTQLAASNTIQFIKPFIGRRRKRFRVGGEEWSPEELSAMILKKIVKDAENAMGGQKKITHCIITVPAFFTEQQRKSTEDAGRIAGLEVMGIINEPTAAALAYGFDTLGMDKTVLVYDLGGGTFDVTVMRISGNTVSMLATDGDVQLGGKDWDERIINHVSEIFLEQHGLDPREDPDALQALYTMVEQAKQRLSKLPATRLAVSSHGKSMTVELSRDEFEAMTEDLLAQTETTLQLTVQEAGLSFEQIDEVLLVGGSTRMRAVRAMIERLTGRPPRQLINPDECVALGAAIHAVMTQIKQESTGKPVPAPHVHEEQLERFRQMEERLINSHTMGILALSGDGRQIVAPLIPRRAFIPAREIKTFRTSVPSQTQIRIKVMEGELENPAGCVELGMALIKGLPEGLPQGTPIEVCFECTTDGVLGVTARLPTIGKTVQTQITRTMGMTDEEIESSKERLNRLRIE